MDRITFSINGAGAIGIAYGKQCPEEMGAEPV